MVRDLMAIGRDISGEEQVLNVVLTFLGDIDHWRNFKLIVTDMST